MIVSQEKLQQKAGLIAFSCILEGPSKKDLYPLIESALPNIVAFLQNNSYSVKMEAAKTLSKIAEFHAETILQSIKFEEMLKIFLISLSQKIKVFL